MKVVQNLSSCLQVVPARFRVTRKSFLVLALVNYSFDVGVLF